MKAPAAQGPCPPQRSPKNHSAQGEGCSSLMEVKWAWFYPVRVPAQGTERTGVLSGLFLKERNSFCLSQVPELPADKGTVILCRSPGRLWQVGPALPGTPAGVQCTAEPRPAAATPGSQQGSAVQKSCVLLASGMFSRKPCSPRRDSRSNSLFLLP